MTPPRSKRARGRPPLQPGVATVELGVSLPAPSLNAVVGLAASARVSVQEIIRRAVVKFVREAQRPTRPRAARSVTKPAARIGV